MYVCRRETEKGLYLKFVKKHTRIRASLFISLGLELPAGYDELLDERREPPPPGDRPHHVGQPPERGVLADTRYALGPSLWVSPDHCHHVRLVEVYSLYVTLSLRQKHHLERQLSKRRESQALPSK